MDYRQNESCTDMIGTGYCFSVSGCSEKLMKRVKLIQEEGYKNICEIGMERICRATKEIAEEQHCLPE